MAYMIVSLYAAFRVALAYLVGRGMKTAEIINLAEDYGYEGFANIAKAAKDGRAEATGRAGGSATPPGGDAGGAAPPAATGAALAIGANLSSGNPVGAAAVGANYVGDLFKGPEWDRSSYDLGPPVPKKTSGGSGVPTIDDLIDEYKKQTGIPEGLHKAMRLVGAHARGDYRNPPPKLWDKIRDMVRAAVKVGRGPEAFEPWLELAALLSYAGDVKNKRARAVGTGLKGPLQTGGEKPLPGKAKADISRAVNRAQQWVRSLRKEPIWLGSTSDFVQAVRARGRKQVRGSLIKTQRIADFYAKGNPGRGRKAMELADPRVPARKTYSVKRFKKMKDAARKDYNNKIAPYVAQVASMAAKLR